MWPWRRKAADFYTTDLVARGGKVLAELDTSVRTDCPDRLAWIPAVEALLARIKAMEIDIEILDAEVEVLEEQVDHGRE